MKGFRKLLPIVLITAILLPTSIALAEDEEVVISKDGKGQYVQIEEEKVGFFGGLGPMLGFEMNQLKSVGGGASVNFGYRFNERFSVLLQTNVLYTRKHSVNYVIIPVLPTLKFSFDNNFFLYAGGGYTFMYASQGTKFSSSVSTPGKNYNGWGVYGGAGYDVWFSFSKRFFISPVVGLDYARVGGHNIILPAARVNFNWMF